MSKVVINYHHNESTDTITKYKKCSVTGEIYNVEVDFKKFKQWFYDGALIHNVFPFLSADHREFLISGFTPAEWDQLMGNGE
jgi:hypothetical protein